MNVVTLIGAVTTPARACTGKDGSYAVVEVEVDGGANAERCQVVARGTLATQLLSPHRSSMLAVDGRIGFDKALDRTVVHAEHVLWLDEPRGS